MKIDSIYYFNYTKDIGFYDSIRDFRAERMTYIGLALSTPKIKVNSSPTEYTLNELVSTKVREHFISRLENLKEISKSLAENSPKYILVCYSNSTSRYFHYDEEFCEGFNLIKNFYLQARKEKVSTNPYRIQQTPESIYSYYPHYDQNIVQSNNKYLSPTYTNQPIQSRAYPTPKFNTQLLGIILSVFIIVFVIVGLVFSFFTTVDDSKPTPIDEPYSGEILFGSEIYDESQITIKSADNKSCVVKLKTRYGTERLSFYVRAGDTVTVGVPAEDLYIYFASGDEWYGNDLLFGKNTSYQKVDDIKNFAEYSWEFTLYPVSDGNLYLETIDKGDF